MSAPKNLAPVNAADARVWASGEIVLEHGSYKSVTASVHAYSDGAAWLEFSFANTLRISVCASADAMRTLGEHMIAAADASEKGVRKAAGWTWSVSYEAATIARGVSASREEARRLAAAAEATELARGLCADKLAWHVSEAS